jgi:hypothetical protein
LYRQESGKTLFLEELSVEGKARRHTAERAAEGFIASPKIKEPRARLIDG